MANSLLRLPEVKRRCGLSRSSIYSFIKDGKFPAPVSLGGPRAVGWPSQSIGSWVAERIAAGRRLGA
jgi:prophage regulatory protein